MPFAARRGLIQLGADIRDARRRRRIPTATMAERALISRSTLHKIERGDPGVALGAVATVLFVLGLSDRIATLAEAAHDTVGLDLEAERLPQRIRARRRRPAPRSGAPVAGRTAGHGAPVSGRLSSRT